MEKKTISVSLDNFTYILSLKPHEFISDDKIDQSWFIAKLKPIDDFTFSCAKKQSLYYINNKFNKVKYAVNIEKLTIHHE